MPLAPAGRTELMGLIGLIGLIRLARLTTRRERKRERERERERAGTGPAFPRAPFLQPQSAQGKMHHLVVNGPVGFVRSEVRDGTNQKNTG